MKSLNKTTQIGYWTYSDGQDFKRIEEFVNDIDKEFEKRDKYKLRTAQTTRYDRSMHTRSLRHVDFAQCRQLGGHGA